MIAPIDSSTRSAKIGVTAASNAAYLSCFNESARTAQSVNKWHDKFETKTKAYN